MRVSYLAMHLEGHLAELDINPLMVLPSGQGVKAVDALIDDLIPYLIASGRRVVAFACVIPAGASKSALRLAGIATVAMMLSVMTPTASLAQADTGIQPPAQAALGVPTIKLLAIGSFTAKASPDVWRPILPSEMRETARLYLAGKIDQWYVKQDQSGVVFILNVTDPKEAHELLDKLPLGQAGLMEFQMIPLGPLSPLRTLLSGP